MGLGVAGSYLALRLSRESGHEVHGFDLLRKADTRCAWGASKHELSRLLATLDLDFSEFILFEGKELRVVFEDGHEFGIPLMGLVSFNKDGLEERLHAEADRAGAKLHLGEKVGLRELSDYDLVIDATGVYRSLLPKIRDDLIFPNIEYRVDYGGSPPFDDFAVFPYPKLGGYSWFFPLGSGMAHVGGGDRFHRQKEKVDALLHRYPGKIVKLISRPIRMVPPALAKPIWLRNSHQTIIGVGESVGAVFPLLGEGIIPSMQAAETLSEHISKEGADPEGYERAIIERFFYFDPIFRAIQAKWGGSWSSALRPSLIPSYIKVKRMERRFGIEVRISHLLEIFNRT